MPRPSNWNWDTRSYFFCMHQFKKRLRWWRKMLCNANWKLKHEFYIFLVYFFFLWHILASQVKIHEMLYDIINALSIYDWLFLFLIQGVNKRIVPYPICLFYYIFLRFLQIFSYQQVKPSKIMLFGYLWEYSVVKLMFLRV